MSEPTPENGRRTQRRRSLFDPVGRIVDSVVPTVTDAMDVDDIVQRIDVEALLRRVDVDELIGRIDVNELLGRLDVDALLARIDVDRLIARIDVDAVVSRVDMNGVMERVDVDALMRRVDVDAVVSRVDVNGVMERVDVDGVMARVDVDAVISRVDVDDVVSRVDVDDIVQRADLAGIVARSTRGITANTVDLLRRQVVGIDEIVTRVAARIARRDPDEGPDAPRRLREPVAEDAPRTAPPTISGNYAGPLARAGAFAIDWWVMVFAYGIATAIVSWTLDQLLGDSGPTRRLDSVWSAVAFVCWALVYFAAPLGLSGRTLGKAIVGLRVVNRDGAPLGPGQALVRVISLPLSVALFGLGLVGAVIGRERRTLHDVIARSTEVIDWGERPAALPRPLDEWLARRQNARSDR